MVDLRDKDPFASAGAEPKDNISTFGFIIRLVVRYSKISIIFYLISALIYYYVSGGSVLGIEQMLP